MGFAGANRAACGTPARRGRGEQAEHGEDTAAGEQTKYSKSTAARKRAEHSEDTAAGKRTEYSKDTVTGKRAEYGEDTAAGKQACSLQYVRKRRFRHGQYFFSCIRNT